MTRRVAGGCGLTHTHTRIRTSNSISFGSALRKIALSTRGLYCRNKLQSPSAVFFVDTRNDTSSWVSLFVPWVGGDGLAVTVAVP